MEIEDPDPKNKRDVIVTFFDVDDFCSALIKNGRTIQSYVFDVCYDPYLIVSSVICRNLHRRGSMRNRGNRGGHGRRDDRDGHGRRNDRDNRESRDNRDNRDSRPHDDRSRDDSYYRRGSHRDGNLHREISGDVRNQTDNYGERHMRNEARRNYKPNNGFRNYSHPRRMDDGNNGSYQRVMISRGPTQRVTV